MTNKQPDALQIAQELEAGAFAPNVLQNERALREIAASALRMLHAELSAIGAGGVEPLRKCLYQIAEPAPIAASAGSEPVAAGWWRKRADEIEAQVAATGSTEAMRCYTDMRTLLQAAAHPSPPEGMVGGWMPIETAPKDGTHILLHAPACDYEGTHVKARTTYGQWRAPSDTLHIKYQDGFAPEPEWEDFEPFWASWDGGFTEEHPPTHWMPLPNPPTTSAGSGKGE